MALFILWNLLCHSAHDFCPSAGKLFKQFRVPASATQQSVWNIVEDSSKDPDGSEDPTVLEMEPAHCTTTELISDRQ